MGRFSSIRKCEMEINLTSGIWILSRASTSIAKVGLACCFRCSVSSDNRIVAPPVITSFPVGERNLVDLPWHGCPIIKRNLYAWYLVLFFYMWSWGVRQTRRSFFLCLVNLCTVYQVTGRCTINPEYFWCHLHLIFLVYSKYEILFEC